MKTPRKEVRDEGMIEKIILGWFLIDAVLQITSKKWRKERIYFLSKLDKKESSSS